MDGASDTIRSFNRFYTRQIGLLDEALLKSPYSLTEARVLFELAHRKDLTATDLIQQLGLDAGYLSRILRRFGKDGLITKKPSEVDGRQTLLNLSRKGRNAFAKLDRRSEEQVSTMLGKLPSIDRSRLLAAMGTIKQILGDTESKQPPYVLRQHRPGDIGWVVHRHGALYDQEYGFDIRFEALVGKIASEFLENFDAKRERCWIAERNGEIIGSVFVVKKSEDVAKLRMLLIEPSARGMGLGKRMVDECIQFAKAAGYKKMTLWTNSILHAARGIYERAGFHLTQSEAHSNFGHDLIGETWELDLTNVQSPHS